MIRPIALTLTGLLAAASLGCDKAGATERQREEQANQQLEQARNEASQRTLSAQAAAEKDIAAARAEFEKRREAYRHDRANDLTDIDKRIADLDAKETVSKDRTKARLQTDLSVIRAKREALIRDMDALDRATAATWDEEKAKIEREWDGLKSAVDKVR
jgi:hypothetical protein